MLWVVVAQKPVVLPSSVKACAYLRQMVVRSAVRRHAEACGLAVVREFASVPEEEISRTLPDGRAVAALST